MSFSTLQTIYIIAYVISALLFILTIVLFFLLNIKKVIGDLTGANARKAIENIRNNNEKTGNKVHKSSAVNIERGKVTSEISKSGKLKNVNSGNIGGLNTSKISTEKLSNSFQSNETTVLESMQNETTLLQVDENATTVLEQNVYVANDEKQISDTNDISLEMNSEISTSLSIEDEIEFAQSKEVIE